MPGVDGGDLLTAVLAAAVFQILMLAASWGATRSRLKTIEGEVSGVRDWTKVVDATLTSHHGRLSRVEAHQELTPLPVRR